MAVCKNCGYDNDPNAIRCYRCGLFLNKISNGKPTLKSAFLDDKDISSSKAGNTIAMMIVNVIYFILVYAAFNSAKAFDSSVLVNLIATTIVSFYTICFELVFNKTGHRWWLVFIPIVNIYTYYKIAFSESSVAIIAFLPIFVIIMVYVLLYFKISLPFLLVYVVFRISKWVTYGLTILAAGLFGKRFGRSFLITVLFFPIIVVSIALSKK